MLTQVNNLLTSDNSTDNDLQEKSYDKTTDEKVTLIDKTKSTQEPNPLNASTTKLTDDHETQLLKLSTIVIYVFCRLFGELNDNQRILSGDDKYLILGLSSAAIAINKGILESNQTFEFSYADIAKSYYSQRTIDNQYNESKNKVDKGSQPFARCIGKKVKHLKKSLLELNLNQPLIEHIPPKNPKGKETRKKSRWKLPILELVKEILVTAKKDTDEDKNKLWLRDWKAAIDKQVILKARQLKRPELDSSPELSTKKGYQALANNLLLSVTKIEQAIAKIFNNIEKDLNSIIDKAKAENVSIEELLHGVIAPVTNSLQNIFQLRINELLEPYFDPTSTDIENLDPEYLKQEKQNEVGLIQNNKEKDISTLPSLCFSVDDHPDSYRLDSDPVDQDTPPVGADIEPDEILPQDKTCSINLDNDYSLNGIGSLESKGDPHGSEGVNEVLGQIDLDDIDLFETDNNIPVDENLEVIGLECKPDVIDSLPNSDAKVVVVGSTDVSIKSHELKSLNQPSNDQDRPLSYVYFYDHADKKVKTDRKVIRWSDFEIFVSNPVKQYEIKNSKCRVKSRVDTTTQDFKNGLAFSPVKYNIPMRCKKNVDGVDILVLDIDGGDLDGYLAICYEIDSKFAYYTTSRYIGDRKNAYFRLLFPFSKLIEANDYLGWWTKMVNIFERDGLTGIDRSGKDVSKIWRVPYKSSKDFSYDFGFFNNGDCIDLLVSPITAEEIIESDSSFDSVSLSYKSTTSTKINGVWRGWMPNYDYFLKNPIYTSDGRIDRSEVDTAFATTAKKRGCSDEDIKIELRFNSEKFASRGVHGEKYLGYIIRYAEKRASYSVRSS